jgi:hypothetical protein
MNVNPGFMVCATLVLVVVGLSLAEESDFSFASPDGEHFVQLKDANGTQRLVIQAAATGQIETSIETATRVLYVHWALNSRALVTVEHITKGSKGRLVYLADNTWRDVEVKPPFDGMMRYKVVNLKLESNYVHYTFAVTKLTSDWKPIDYLFCDFDVSLNAGKLYNVRWTPTSTAVFEATLLRNPTYFPPM